jgi:hypothetical protein
MRRQLAFAACLLFLIYASVISAKNKEPRLIVEVYVLYGNDVAFTKDHPYLRVYDDGRAEYSDKKENANDVIYHESKLSPTQLKSLIEFLDNAEIKDLSGMYPAYPPTINFGAWIEIFITRDSKTQGVGTHFVKRPAGRNEGQRSPQALVDLICRIEGLREKATFRVTWEGYCSR